MISKTNKRKRKHKKAKANNACDSNVAPQDSQWHPPWPPVSAVALPHPACGSSQSTASPTTCTDSQSASSSCRLMSLEHDRGDPHLCCCCSSESIKQWWWGLQKLFNQWGRMRGTQSHTQRWNRYLPCRSTYRESCPAGLCVNGAPWQEGMELVKAEHRVPVKSTGWSSKDPKIIVLVHWKARAVGQWQAQV